MGRIRNSKGGTSIVELGPALFVLVIVVMIPVCDLLAMLCSYTAGWLLNEMCARECACKNPTLATDITRGVFIADSAWKSNILISGLAQARGATTLQRVTYVRNDGVTFVSNLTADGSGNVSGSPVVESPAPSTNSYIATCQVLTTLPVKPLFVVPFVGSVPGLSAPINFVYFCQRPQEEKGFQ